MNEASRLQDLKNYNLLDTAPERELDELVEIASVICGTPISLLTLLDEKRQWFKAKIGIDATETPRDISFCRYALNTPKEVLVIEDALKDVRFKNNPLVLGNPYIRFYAGAPLVTFKGNVLGTLCIVDTKPRKISKQQRKALQLLAKKVMHYLDTNKILADQGNELEKTALKLQKLTDYAPGALFQLERRKDGSMFFPFLSKGFEKIHPELDLEVLKMNAHTGFDAIHPDDVESFQKSLEVSFENLTPWNEEYRVFSEEGLTKWHWANAKPERKENGSVVWHGTFQDITARKEYINTLEQIIFDISHVIRKPVANMLGLTSAIKEYNLDPVTLKEYISHLKNASEEMDHYIKKLNKVYSERKLKATKSKNFTIPEMDN